MGSVSILRTISMVFNLFLIHISLSDGFLSNYICAMLLRSTRKTPNYIHVIKTYYIQIVLNAILITSLIYLLVCSFINGFLTFTNFSKYLKQTLLIRHRVFLTIIPMLIIIGLAAFGLNLLFLQPHYAPPKGLYHIAPHNFKSGKIRLR